MSTILHHFHFAVHFFSIHPIDNDYIARISPGSRAETSWDFAEKVEFSGIYEEGKNNNIDNMGIAKNGDRVEGTLWHYACYLDWKNTRFNLAQFYILDISGPQGSQRYWSEREYSESHSINRIGFLGLRRVENDVAYKYSYEYNSIDIAFRGGVVDGELEELWVEFEGYGSKKDAGIVICDEIRYTNTDDTEVATRTWLMDIFSVDKNSTLGTVPGIPVEYQNLTADESVEKNGGYYDENAVYHTRKYFQGIGKKDYEYSNPTLKSKIEMTVNKNFDGISSDMKTTYTIYEIIVDVSSELDEIYQNTDYTLLCISGNLGEKWYNRGNMHWYIPEGVTIIGLEDLDDTSAYYGWSEIAEINDEYFDYAVGDVGNITIRFSDKKRTGVDAIEFSFDGITQTATFDDLEYTGPFLSYFFPYSKNWPEMAKSFGLTPIDRE